MQGVSGWWGVDRREFLYSSDGSELRLWCMSECFRSEASFSKDSARTISRRLLRQDVLSATAFLFFCVLPSSIEVVMGEPPADFKEKARSFEKISDSSFG